MGKWLVFALMAPLSAAAQSTGTAWDWQLSEPADLSRSVDVLDLDPGLVMPGQSTALHRRGVRTLICYVSVGTAEDYRDDIAAFPAEVLGRRYDDWPAERFVDIRRLDILLPIMQARFDICRTLGFDAIEPDNMDVADNDSGFDIAPADTLRYLRALSDMAHDMGLGIGQKNLGGMAAQLEPMFDFAITEDCLADGWCDQMAPYLAAGKAILAAEYDVDPADRLAKCEQAKTIGLSLIFKTPDLDSTGSGCP